MVTQLSILEEKQQKAEHLLSQFSAFTDYKHGIDNPYREWLDTNPALTIEEVVKFLRFWYPISRHQPQILLRCTAAYDEWEDRKLMMQNYLEEDGMVQEGHKPHYDLLQWLINKLDNNFKVSNSFRGDIEADKLISAFHNTLGNMTPAQATGYVAAIEHPALDISFYFNKIIALCGKPELLTSDLYLTIHVAVEPDHIIWAHGNALKYIENGKGDEVIGAYQNGMSLWIKFWQLAFAMLNCPFSRKALTV